MHACREVHVYTYTVIYTFPICTTTSKTAGAPAKGQGGDPHRAAGCPAPALFSQWLGGPWTRASSATGFILRAWNLSGQGGAKRSPAHWVPSEGSEGPRGRSVFKKDDAWLLPRPAWAPGPEPIPPWVENNKVGPANRTVPRLVMQSMVAVRCCTAREPPVGAGVSCFVSSPVPGCSPVRSYTSLQPILSPSLVVVMCSVGGCCGVAVFGPKLRVPRLSGSESRSSRGSDFAGVVFLALLELGVLELRALGF